MSRRAASFIGARSPAAAGTLAGVDHGTQKAGRGGLMRLPTLGERAHDPPGLELGKPQREFLTPRRREQQALAPVGEAGPLLDEILVDQFLEHPIEALLGDLQDVEQLGDGEAGAAVDEVQHPVMRAPKPEISQNSIGIGDEIAIGEEEQLDDVVSRLLRKKVARFERMLRGCGLRHRRKTLLSVEGHYVSLVDTSQPSRYSVRLRHAWRRRAVNRPAWPPPREERQEDMSSSPSPARRLDLVRRARPWKDAKRTVLSHGLHYGSSVFEGRARLWGEGLSSPASTRSA
jgi:hypothetical protein